jgi:hypothetical protein
MDDLSHSRTTAVAIARDLAAAHPAAKLPCPVCGTTLRADNLDKHLQKTHAATAPTTAQLHWRGTDRRAIRPLLALAILCALALAALQGALARGYGPPQIALSAVLVLVLALIALAVFERLPASLTLDGDTLRLRYCLGLLTRTVRLPASLEVGTLVQFRHDLTTPDEVHATGQDVRSGHYLRLADLTIACTHKSGFRSHWNPSGWRPGPRRRAWDITLGRAAEVELEYQLAARGMLSPKTDDT